MKKSFLYPFLYLALLTAQFAGAQTKINVVTTLSTYADIVKAIGGDKVQVKHIVAGNQDAHFVKPKPSFALWLRKADLFVSTGMDLELWAPMLVDKSGNPKIRSGQIGYVSVSDGIPKLEVPVSADRSQGDVHIFGNPHLHTSPINAITIAENITIGLSKISPANSEFFKQNFEHFKREIEERLYGKKLVGILGGEILNKLTLAHQLIPFLQSKSLKGRKLINFLGGWMKAMLPLRGKKIIAYHKNWAYFEDIFGIEIVDYIEPKPGIPPSPKHVEDVINTMRKYDVQVVMAANFFDKNKVRDVADKVGGKAVIVPFSVGGNDQVHNYFELVDYWVSHLRAAFGLKPEL